ncbi:MAG: bifunctional folylpolyglutamate synthase/dihydrofolate synthase [Bacteroidales bacterium]|jgi:dihydrofolate synthase/folylpolyglutamate synthase|nr:bifunctional folylpolyglutamate synthase/dihydrofolate synthase [Bacteroidales bacterium]
MNYRETVEFLFSSLPVFHHSGGVAYKPGLQTITELDDFYAQPHKKFKSIHVAGTNGKGSVSHLLAAALQGSGYLTGLFTSPHLEDFRERIKINGEMISEQEVIDFVEKSRGILEKVQPSFFEMTTAMAFDHFARHHVEVAVIETGMGGRLDATNIIEPILSVITNISLDHTQFLGNNPIAIATEKAGIIKPRVPVVIGETQAGADKVLMEKAGELGCKIIFADQHAAVSRSWTEGGSQTFYFRQDGKELPLPVVIDLAGEYQQKNIVTTLIAIMALRQHTSIQIKNERIVPSLKHAAQTTGLRGRWQRLQEHPLVICDTAHNVAGMAQVARQLAGIPHLRIVAGFVNDKDISGMLELLPKDAIYYFTQASIPRALDAQVLQQKAQEYGLKGSHHATTALALRSALRDAATEDTIFVGGSIFVVGEILQQGYELRAQQHS